MRHAGVGTPQDAEAGVICPKHEVDAAPEAR
jgi:hypothetical protein